MCSGPPLPPHLQGSAVLFLSPRLPAALSPQARRTMKDGDHHARGRAADGALLRARNAPHQRVFQEAEVAGPDFRIRNWGTQERRDGSRGSLQSQMPWEAQAPRAPATTPPSQPGAHLPFPSAKPTRTSRSTSTEPSITGFREPCLLERLLSPSGRWSHSSCWRSGLYSAWGSTLAGGGSHYAGRRDMVCSPTRAGS